MNYNMLMGKVAMVACPDGEKRDAAKTCVGMTDYAEMRIFTECKKCPAYEAWINMQREYR